LPARDSPASFTVEQSTVKVLPETFGLANRRAESYWTRQRWVVDGPKIPLVFIGLWLVGWLGFPHLGVSGTFFLALEALMAAGLLIIAQYKSSL
jgi:hypothetical protein